MFLTVGIKAIIGKMVYARTAKGLGILLENALMWLSAITVDCLGTLLQNVHPKQCAGIVRNLGILQTSAAMIQSATCVTKQGIWHVHAQNPVTQEFATIALKQGTLLWIAPMEKHVTIAERQVTLLVNALMTQSAISAMYQATSHVNAPKQLLRHK